MTLAEKKFKEDFITSFLATWSVTNYKLYRQDGRPRMPIIEAEEIACDAWNLINPNKPRDIMGKELFKTN